jgi:hypothetical protein
VDRTLDGGPRRRIVDRTLDGGSRRRIVDRIPDRRRLEAFDGRPTAMDGSSVTATVRDESETELSRLSSSKALYAATGGEMDAAAVRRAVAGEARRAAAVVDEWADDESAEAAATLFEDVAATLRGQHERLDADAGAVDHPMYDRLAGLDGTVERLGGLLARTLVADGAVGQAVGFFVGDANPAGADELREVRDELDDQRERVETALASALEDADADEASAVAAATATVDAAYDWYVETLESMGVKPKNVC